MSGYFILFLIFVYKYPISLNISTTKLSKGHTLCHSKWVYYNKKSGNMKFLMFPINILSNALGYCNIAHFSNTFKEITGLALILISLS